MPIDITPKTTSTRLEFLRACQALCDYTSTGITFASTKDLPHPHLHNAWKEENAAAWKAFRALPRRDQRGWAEALFAASLGIDQLGEVKERQAFARTQTLACFKFPLNLVSAICALAASPEEAFQNFACETDWKPGVENLHFTFFHFSGREREMELQVFEDKSHNIVKIWDVGGQAWL